MDTDFPSFIPTIPDDNVSEKNEVTSKLVHIWNGYCTRAPATVLAVLEDLAEHSETCPEGISLSDAKRDESPTVGVTHSSGGTSSMSLTTGSSQGQRMPGNSQQTSSTSDSSMECVKCYLHENLRDDLSLYNAFRVDRSEWKELELKNSIERSSSRLLGILHNCLEQLNIEKNVVTDNRQTPYQGESLHPGRVHEGVVQRIYSITGIRPNDFFIDIGSGDGYAVLALAAISGCHGMGVEVIDSRFALSKRLGTALLEILYQLYGNKDDEPPNMEDRNYWPSELSAYHHLTRILLSLHACWDPPSKAHPEHLESERTGKDVNEEVHEEDEYLFGPHNYVSRLRKQTQWQDQVASADSSGRKSGRPHLNDVVLDTDEQEDLDFLKSSLPAPSVFSMPRGDGSSVRPKFREQQNVPLPGRYNIVKYPSKWKCEMEKWRSKLVDAVQRAGDLSLGERVFLAQGDVMENTLDGGLPAIALSHARVVFCNNFDGRWLADRFQDRLLLKFTRHMTKGAILVSCYPFVRLPRAKSLTHTVKRLGSNQYTGDSYTSANLYFAVHGGLECADFEFFGHHQLCEWLVTYQKGILPGLRALGFPTPSDDEQMLSDSDAVIATAEKTLNMNPTRHKATKSTLRNNPGLRSTSESDAPSESYPEFTETHLVNLALDICNYVWIRGHDTEAREELSRSLDKHSRWPEMNKSLPYHKRKPEIVQTPKTKERAYPSAYHHLPWMSEKRKERYAMPERRDRKEFSESLDFSFKKEVKKETKPEGKSEFKKPSLIKRPKHRHKKKERKHENKNNSKPKSSAQPALPVFEMIPLKGQKKIKPSGDEGTSHNLLIISIAIFCFLHLLYLLFMPAAPQHSNSNSQNERRRKRPRAMDFFDLDVENFEENLAYDGADNGEAHQSKESKKNSHLSLDVLAAEGSALMGASSTEVANSEENGNQGEESPASMDWLVDCLSKYAPESSVGSRVMKRDMKDSKHWLQLCFEA